MRSSIGLKWHGWLPRSVVDLFTYWRVLRGKSQIAAVWNMIPLCLTWCIWFERKDWCFGDKGLLVDELDVSLLTPYFFGLQPKYSTKLVFMISLFLFLAPDL